MNISIDDLVAVGGNEWINGTRHRVYFNDLPELFGRLSCSYYGTGNIRHATLDRKEISNTSARGIMYSLSEGKVWFDVALGQFSYRIPNCSRYNGDTMGDAIVVEISKRLAEHAKVTAATIAHPIQPTNSLDGAICV